MPFFCILFVYWSNGSMMDQPQQKSKKAKADGRKNIESFQEVSIIFHKKKNSYKVRFG